MILSLVPIIAFQGTFGYLFLKDPVIFLDASPIISICLTMALCLISSLKKSSLDKPLEKFSIFSILSAICPIKTSGSFLLILFLFPHLIFYLSIIYESPHKLINQFFYSKHLQVSIQHQ